MRRGLGSRPAKHFGAKRRAVPAWLYVGMAALTAACSASTQPPPPAKQPPSPPATRGQGAVQPPAPTARPEAPDPVSPGQQARYGALCLDAKGALGAFSNRSARWSPARRAIVFLSDRDGAWKAYTAGWGALNLPPRAVSGPKGPIVDADFHPDGTGIFLVEASDAGSSLFFSDLETHAFRPWGPAGVHIKQAPIRASLSRSALALLAENPSRVFLGSAASPAQQTIPLNESTLAAMSPGGQRLLTLERHGNADARIVEINGPTHRVLVSAQEGLELEAAAYAPDGKSILYAARSSDGPSQVLRLGSKGPASLVFEPDASIQVLQLASSARSPSAAALTWSPKGMAVYLLQPNGYRKARKVGLPEGVGSLGAFSRDGRVLTITWETPEGPSDLYEVTTDLGRLRKLRADVRPTLAALEGMRWRRESIPTGDGPLEATVYEPRGSELTPGESADATDKRAAVLLLGEDGPPAPAWRPSIRFLVGIGLVIVEPRSASGTRPQQLSTAEAKRWMDALDSWLPTQSWWAKGKRAVIGRSNAARPVLDAVGRVASPWVTLCNPPETSVDWRFEGPSLDSWDMLVSCINPNADTLVHALRGAGARVEYAVSEDASTRLAREALFLQRVLGSRAVRNRKISSGTE